MQNSERLFILILVIVGLVFLYIMSIFFAPQDHLSQQKVEPLYVQDQIDDSDEIELNEESRTPLFAGPNIGGNLNFNEPDDRDPILIRILSEIQTASVDTKQTFKKVNRQRLYLFQRGRVD